MKEYTQEYLEQIYKELPEFYWENAKEMYRIASLFTEEKANEKNYYLNSIGFWESRKTRPKRKPDHISYNIGSIWKTGKIKISSEYWYTEKGVIRGSNHWGMDIASCSWFIKDRKYPIEGIVIGGKEYAFISWDELKAKGFVRKHWKTGVYSLGDFKFE